MKKKASKYKLKNFRTLTVDAATHKRLKLISAEKGKTMKDFMSELLRKYDR